MSSKLNRERIRQFAQEEGFSECRFTKARLPESIGRNLIEFLRQGWQGDMTWLETTAERRVSPEKMWPDAKSAIVLGMNYGPEQDPMEALSRTESGNISVYARNRDYHDVIKGKLKVVAQKIAKMGCAVKVFVDTAPLMEKPLAAQAGLGWQGKHTNLVSREFGSWLFIGIILTGAEIEPDKPENDHCGNCRACLDICPTRAFPGPYQLDARRCISYLTIEHKGPIPVEFREHMGNRIYGCDDCLAICPWNKFACTAREAKLSARADFESPELRRLAGLDDAGFRRLFSGSPIKRIGRNRFIRNVLIAIGNSGTQSLLSAVKPHVRDSNSVVRGTAVWAAWKLSSEKDFTTLYEQNGIGEPDPAVVFEWEAGLDISKDRKEAQ